MEDERKLTPEDLEKHFKLDLDNAPADVRDRYYALKLAEQMKMAKRNKNMPGGSIPLEKREEFFRIAKTTKNIEEAKRIVKMDEDWKAHTSKDGRPPIGGAPDD